jgi:PadR family transcriptional regulator, regulatory protein PadR
MTWGSAEAAARKAQDVSGMLQDEDEGGGMDQEPRLSERAMRILEVFVDRPDVWHFGLELAEAVGLRHAGTIAPDLDRLEQLGWILSGWEDADQAAAEGCRPRRCYRLSDEGRRSGGRAALARWRRDALRQRGWSARPGEVYAGR